MRRGAYWLRADWATRLAAADEVGCRWTGCIAGLAPRTRDRCGGGTNAMKEVVVYCRVACAKQSDPSAEAQRQEQMIRRSGCPGLPRPGPKGKVLHRKSVNAWPSLNFAPVEVKEIKPRRGVTISRLPSLSSSTEVLKATQESRVFELKCSPSIGFRIQFGIGRKICISDCIERVPKLWASSIVKRVIIGKAFHKIRVGNKRSAKRN